ncbi:MAG: hypothetical protein K2N89_04585 [Lachnospiraceae bacterium]|nr:hypothetical protein [Lachnospiraceae bacterium]
MAEFEESRTDGEEATIEDVKEIKSWMFQEQVRIQARRDELMEFNHELVQMRHDLEREREDLNAREKALKKRYENNEALIAKELKIIEDAYRQLELDKKALECERLNLEHEKSKYRKQKMSGSNRSNAHQYGGATDAAYDGTSFFRGVDSELTLRKRYKELLKIFHPDNKCGDAKTLIKIQTEYDSLRSQYYEG